MTIFYVDTGGNIANSGTSDNNSPDFSGSAATVVTTTVSLDGSPDLSALATDGSQAIYLNDATNTNRKIFKITGKDNTAKTVTVDTAPTGVTSSSWRIGGRIAWPSGSTAWHSEAALLAGDILQINNSPASRTGIFITHRVNGNSTAGFITVRGKSGVRPVIAVNSTGNVLTGNSCTNIWVENLEIANSGASGTAIASYGTNFVFKNVKLSDAGGAGISVSANGRFIGCEISGCGGDGVSASQAIVMYGCYVHDNTGDGVEISLTAPTQGIIGCIIESNGGRGVYLSGATTTDQGRNFAFYNNTIYGNVDSGLEIADADTCISMWNNIFQDNGNGAGKYNVEWAAGAAEYQSDHGYNCFYHQGGGGGANLSGLTANSTEVTTDPLFVDAANGDFRIGSTSPAKAVGYPGAFLGGPTGYMDMGAVQRQESSSGGLLRHPGMNGGFNA